MIYIPVIASIVLTILLIRIFRKQIIKWLMKLRAKLKIQSLRGAIKEADKDKEDTQRKNMVVYNTVSGQFEPIQKRVLKHAEKAGKNKNNAKMTDGRKKFMKRKKKLLHQGVKEMEEKSLYVTN